MRFKTEIADRLRQAVPADKRKQLTKVRLRGRALTATWSDLPAFLLIGTERGGTSSLYKYLGFHPQIAPSLRKETEYFNRHVEMGESWYRAHFPLRARRRLAERRGSQLLPFEASPFYIFDPRVPARVASLLPDARFLVLLWNPIARAVSKWRHLRELGFEDLEFSAAIEAEESRIAGEFERMVVDPTYYSKPFFRYSYLEGGKYADQIRRWFAYFPSERFLFVKSEDFYGDTSGTYGEMLRFLGVRQWRPEEFRMYSSATSSNPAVADRELSAELRARLEDYFRPFDKDLEELLGRSFGWFE